MSEKKAALDYHEYPNPGKVSTTPIKSCETARDLSLAYSPGVAVPCLEIAANPDDVYRYTSKGNLVAVISNGTAVLGLGDIGPAASKPVMEGKGVLFKRFAHIDVFDIELNSKTVDEVVNAVAALAPTFGGINLEDIKAPECFEIEKQLIEKLDIPVFHDDQHGTAIIAAAALINALEVVNKDIKKIKIVVSGAGAAAISCAKLLIKLGLNKNNLLLVDSKGVIYKGRTESMNVYKQDFVVETAARTLSDAMKDADVFFGLSAKDLLTPDMLLSMADSPIVFAMANPDPEIDYNLAKATRADVIMATGRSDFPNQVNNVLGFPYIFRGALDVRAKTINEEMKLAAVFALSKLAKEPVPDSVVAAYQADKFNFGPEYLIPKPFDPRVLYYVAPAVAKAAMETGVARININIEEYTRRLKGMQNKGREVLSNYYDIAKTSKRKRIAFPEGANEKIIKAAAMAMEEGIVEPVLLGKREIIEAEIRRLELDINKFEIIEPPLHLKYKTYVEEYYQAKSRKGINQVEAERAMRLENYFANMMLSQNDVDGVICGLDRSFPEMMKPILDIVGLKEGVKNAAALFLVDINDQLFFFADTAVNIEMTSEKLANIAIMSAEFAKSMQEDPRVALLSLSNFGSVKDPSVKMVRDALKIVQEKNPHLQIDGEMQADTAVVTSIIKQHYPFCNLESAANVLIFPDMQSANISFKLLQRLGGARVIGPIILGLNAPAYVLQRHATADEIFNLITVAVAQANIQQMNKDSDRVIQRPKMIKREILAANSN
ncbi:MAG: NADP-dependent malic enzyme [Proteobacteria bacterium]|nr:NADP-dependent malic enzyme [Pseudomonadota bacterium]